MSTAREPYAFGGEWCWCRGGPDTFPEVLPAELFNLLTGGEKYGPTPARYYPTRAAALAALADAERRAGA